MYNYFISFNYVTGTGDSGSGCTFISLEEKITSKTNLELLSGMIKKAIQKFR